MSRAQRISRYGWASIYPTPTASDPNPMPRINLWRRQS